MFKSALRSTPRQALLRSRPSPATKCPNRRLLSTAPPSQKSRSWKSSAARWGVAIGGLYYYNTSNLFAEGEEAAIKRLDQSMHNIQDSKLPTLEAIEEERQQRREEIKRQELEKQKELEGRTPVADEEQSVREGEEDEEGMGGLEEEADQQGAFNPETGEINWDCPCLGGMAHGPCGDEFREAFSCFVHSKEEPKGMECIEKFKGMQDCFRAHPEVYASELEEEEVEEELEGRESARQNGVEDRRQPSDVSSAAEPHKTSSPNVEKSDAKVTPKSESALAPSTGGDEGGELVTKAVQDSKDNKSDS